MVKGPYMILGGIILAVAILFFFTKLPDIKEEETSDKASGFVGVLKHTQVRWGIVAQFFYIGAQVYVFSFLLVFAKEMLGMSGLESKYYAGVAGFLFMIGRFIGSFFMKFVQPAKLLAAYGIISCALTLVVIFGSGMVTLYALLGITFFMSIMFPTIFAMGIQGVGHDT
ncbi:MFS transporter, partial [Brucella sp. 21LCYQ03]|nr:MFS transporter [Brucella sp. 21LCYQ03]